MLEAIVLVADIGLTSMNHSWGPPMDRPASYDFVNKSVGLTAWYGNYGFRIAHGKGERANTEGHFDRIEIDFKHITSYELMYKYEMNYGVSLFGGIGHYQIPTPAYYKATGDLHRLDADDDEGFFLGVHYDFNDSFGVQYRYTQFSEIQHAEYTVGHGLHLTYKF